MATKTQQSTSKPGSSGRPVIQAAAREVAKIHKQHAVALSSEIDFAADERDGMQGIDADSVAIPFLAVLQKMSPVCDPDSPEYMPKAKAGMLMNTVTKELFDGKEGVLLVPCNYSRKYLRWTPREKGGGFKGELAPEVVVRMRREGALIDLDNRLFVPDDHGNVNPKANDKVSDTRVHYVLVLSKSGAAQQAVLSLTSTQIKKSKLLNSLLSNVEIDTPRGKVTPASYANLVRITTVPEQNDQGSWSGVRFELEGLVAEAPLYQMGRAFSKLVDAGRATVNFEAPGASAMGEEDFADEAAPPARGGGQRGGRF